MKFIVFFCTLFLFAASSFARDTISTNSNTTTELWEGKALTAVFRVGICYTSKGQARGVLLLRHRNGQEDTYHLNGTLKNGEFFLTHSSGHKLAGNLSGPHEMEGKAKLANGLSLRLKGKRSKDVPLAAPDCAPLPAQKAS